MSAATDAYMATSPIHFWPLDETSGTTANDLAGALDGTCSGMTMGANVVAPTDVPNAPPGIGGISPWFTGGTEHIVVNTNKILGGLNEWSIGAWILPAMDTNSRAWYGEGPPSGTDLLVHSMMGGNPSVPEFRYGHDSHSADYFPISGLFVGGTWIFMVITRSGNQTYTWWNLGRRGGWATVATGNTWTNSSIASWIGGSPRAYGGSAGWRGFISHLALWDRVIDRETDMRPIYEACSPLARDLLNEDVFSRSNGIWKQRLDTADDLPQVSSLSAATAAKMSAQFTNFTGGANTSTGPVWVGDAGTTRQVVRVAGGKNNIAAVPLDFWTALQSVPLPAGFAVPLVSDRQGQVYATDTKELWEFIQMEQALTPPDPPHFIPGGSGSLPQGQYVYAVAGELANGDWGQWSFGVVTLNGSQSADLTWHEVEGCHHYGIYRADPDPTTKLAVLPWRRITTVPVGTLHFVDNLPHGNDELDHATAGHAIAITTDWGCSYGGYMNHCDTSVGYYESPHTNWGASASGAPLLAGSITISEMLANEIPHALYIGLPRVDASGKVYPAQRNDGNTNSSDGIQEGTRLQLDPAYDPSALPRWEKMVAIALQKYGGYVRDTTVEVSIYCEDQFMLGRDFYPDIFEGRYAHELFDSVNFPFDQLRVIEPTWTQTHTLPPPGGVTPKLETLTDDFSLPSPSVTNWPSSGGSTILNGELHIQCTPSYNGGLSAGPHTYDVTSSSMYFKVPQVPFGDSGNEGGFTLYNASDLTCYIEMVYTDNGLLVCGYNSSSHVRTRVVEPTYNATTHAWWRIRHASGTIYWDTSVNGTTWDNLGSIAWASTGWSSSMLQSMFPKWFAGNFSSHSGNPDFVIDNVNIAPNGSVVSDATTLFESESTRMKLAKASWGHLEIRGSTIALSGTYTTGGDVLSPEMFGMTELVHIMPLGMISDGSLSYLPSFSLETGKLSLWKPNIYGNLVEFDNGDSVDGLIMDCIGVGH